MLKLLVLLVVIFLSLGELQSQASPPCPILPEQPSHSISNTSGNKVSYFQEVWDV